MKKIAMGIVMICISSYTYSQDTNTELTDKQKTEMRNNHKSGLTFSNAKSTGIAISSKKLATSNTVEEKEDNATTTTVKYYYGKKDSLYKEFKYVKP